MERWERLKPGGLRFVWTEGQFPPGLDSFLLSSLPRLKPGLRVCDLGCGTGLLSLLLRSGEAGAWAAWPPGRTAWRTGSAFAWGTCGSPCCPPGRMTW